LHALAKPEGLANEFEDVGFVSKPIKQGRGQAFITEDFMMPPFWNA
jgi:hypothetical protein